LTLHDENFIIAAIGGTVLALTLINTFFIWFFVGRHFDKIFPNYVNHKNAIENGWWILSPLFRATRYGSCILFRNYMKTSIIKGYMKYYFNGYDFYANARRIDKFVVWFHIAGAFVAGSLGIMLHIIDN